MHSKRWGKTNSLNAGVNLFQYYCVWKINKLILSFQDIAQIKDLILQISAVFMDCEVRIVGVTQRPFCSKKHDQLQRHASQSIGDLVAIKAPEGGGTHL